MKRFTVAEAAAELRLSEGTVRTLLQSKRLRHERHGRKYLIPEDAIEEYRRSVTVEANGDEQKPVPVAVPKLILKHLNL